MPVLVTGNAVAQVSVDTESGRVIAEGSCSACHRLGSQRERQLPEAAPSFAEIAAMPSTTALSLRAFLQTSHSPMPDLVLSHDDIDDLAAYILSLRPSR